MKTKGEENLSCPAPSFVPTGKKLSVTISRPRKQSKHDKSTQTIYRDSEAQTLPWSPEVIFRRRGNGPRVVPDSLIPGDRPLTMEDMILIERTRQKQAWEDTLPRTSSKWNDTIRLSCVTSIAANEIAYREAILDAQREERLALSKRIMKEKREEMMLKLRNRLENMKIEKNEENSAIIEYWNRQFRRKIRKLMINRLEFGGKMRKIVFEPRTARETPASDRFSSRTEMTTPLARDEVGFSRYLAEFSGIELLEKQMTVSSQPKFSKSEKPSKSGNACSRTLRNWENELEMLRTGEKGKQSMETESLSSRVSLRKRVRYSLEKKSEMEMQEAEEANQASLLIGKIIKGRAIQTKLLSQRYKALRSESGNETESDT